MLSGPWWSRPFRVIYIYAVVLISIFVMAFSWYIVYQVFSEVQSVAVALAHDLKTNSTAYELADTFIGNVFNYFLILMLFGLMIWAFVYAQRKGQPMVMAE